MLLHFAALDKDGNLHPIPAVAQLAEGLALAITVSGQIYLVDREKGVGIKAQQRQSVAQIRERIDHVSTLKIQANAK